MQLVYRKDMSHDNDATALKMLQLVEASKLRQKKIAGRMGIKPPYLSDLLSGRRNWSEAIALRLIKAINGAKR